MRKRKSDPRLQACYKELLSLRAERKAEQADKLEAALLKARQRQAAALAGAERAARLAGLQS